MKGIGHFMSRYQFELTKGDEGVSYDSAAGFAFGLYIRVFQLRRQRAGRVVAKRRIETKHCAREHRSLGFDTLRYSTGVR
jgi:hypothetical protein